MSSVNIFSGGFNVKNTIRKNGVLFLILYVCMVNVVHSFLWNNAKPKNSNICLDLPLDQRENQAEVVITGTVTHTMPDLEHLGMYKGDVKVLRIVKGKSILDLLIKRIEPRSRKKMIMVEGFGDSHICNSEVRKHDTRIFLLSRGDNQALKLNSSILRMSVSNLERIDKAVKDIPFQPPQEQSQSPCDGIFCKFHGQCLITLDNVAKCSCIDVCTTEVEKVCGTNYMTFNNECELKRFSCHQKKRINIGYYGACKPDPCKEYRNCTYPSVCQLDNNRKPVCKCHEACPDDLRMVCGSNGKTYGNPCLLRREACLTNNLKLVRIKDGKCAADNPCRQIRCPHGSCKLDRNNNPVCLCRERCVPVVKPVCATNRMDFDNVCELNRYACNNKLDIAVLRQGNCASASPCDKTVCPTNQFCVLNNNGEPKCQCKSCSDEVFYPICGTDRKTYNSRCHLQQINCQKRTNVREVHTGYCAGEGCGMFKKCPLYQFCEGTGSNAKCKCPTNKTCVNTKAEVCGNDFKKYHNECFLRAAACQQNKTMYIISLGECELCNGKTCQFGAECQNNECVCPKFCARGGQPVCANNGKKYINRCEMERAECLGRINLYEVLCKDQDSSTDIVPGITMRGRNMVQCMQLNTIRFPQ